MPEGDAEFDDDALAEDMNYDSDEIKLSEVRAEDDDE